MKKMFCLLLAALLLLTGCKAGDVSQTTAAPAEPTPAPTESVQVPMETQIPETLPDVTAGFAEPNTLWFQNPGKVRISYRENCRYVRYITSPDQLPEEEALKGYDEAFFEEHALLIVVETVSSGSLQLEIGSIEVSGDTATVKLNRTMPGDVGTTDMATWMLWAEVEKDLSYNWNLEGQTNQTAGSKY